MSAYNFVHSGQNFTKFFFVQCRKDRFRQRRLDFVAIFIVFQSYSRSNSKIVVKRTKFWTFFALPNFKGGGAPKFRTCVNTPT